MARRDSADPGHVGAGASSAGSDRAGSGTIQAPWRGGCRHDDGDRSCTTSWATRGMRRPPRVRTGVKNGAEETSSC